MRTGSGIRTRDLSSIEVTELFTTGRRRNLIVCTSLPRDVRWVDGTARRPMRLGCLSVFAIEAVRGTHQRRFHLVADEVAAAFTIGRLSRNMCSRPGNRPSRYMSALPLSYPPVMVGGVGFEPTTSRSLKRSNRSLHHWTPLARPVHMSRSGTPPPSHGSAPFAACVDGVPKARTNAPAETVAGKRLIGPRGA